jgi:GH15 family glucan-1,4-alpha-glucosidase
MSNAFTVNPEVPPSDDPRVRHALRLAVGDLLGNVRPFQDGLLTTPAPCLIAGLEYVTPWTRDAAFNVWFGLSRLAPEVATHTLLAVLERTPGGTVRIGGQYWDAIIWAQGAWAHYTETRDRAFLTTAQDAVRHSLARFEAEEFDAADGLFRGGACFQDGVAAYPDFYTPGPDDPPFSGIDVWTEMATQKRFPIGGGIPCKALSTNCLYYRAYRVAQLMAAELGIEPDPTWAGKAERLRAAINARFWSEKLGRYRYLVDAPGEDDRQEGLGLAFALLFDVADTEQARRIFENTHLTPHGIPCVWPTYPRYAERGEYGRHSGPIWPQVNAAWALACVAHGRRDLAEREMISLAEKAARDGGFCEVFHPDTGLPYGGLQEHHERPGIELYPVLRRQSWCASGFIAMARALCPPSG